MGYSLQSNRKTMEGSEHPDRDAKVSVYSRACSTVPTTLTARHFGRHKKKELAIEMIPNPRIRPRTGKSSMPYTLRRTEGTPSTPARKSPNAWSSAVQARNKAIEEIAERDITCIPGILYLCPQ